ncbi:hypothetical protein NDU88_005204 [Pleurodeles waltl]|uniref:Uncharacterized protein n=1 Tax=Pleurodeles waltl TaxID=8319 RepID=A0AAV7WXK8_PLEWA|nr:hypothetical protein NDU88_005204 [Pleurodeles waltl]
MGRFSANTDTDSSDWRCSRVSEECVYRSHDSMGADPDGMNPDFRVPVKEKLDDGLRGEKEEETEDATDANRRAEEPKDTGEQNGEGAAGNPDVPRMKTGPVKKNNREETRIHRHAPGGTWLNKGASSGMGQKRVEEPRAVPSLQCLSGMNKGVTLVHIKEHAEIEEGREDADMEREGERRDGEESEEADRGKEKKWEKWRSPPRPRRDVA